MIQTTGPVRTLVVHTGGIGDLIVVGPAIQRLRRDGPVTLAGQPERVELLVEGGAADYACSLDSIDIASVFTEPSRRLRDALNAIDRAAVWMHDADGVIRSAFERCGLRDVRAFPGLPPKSWTRHASVYYTESLGEPAPEPLRLHFNPADIPLDVVIHPGSGGADKNWPVDRFVELAERLAADGRDVSWVLGPAERERGLADTPRPGTILPDMPLNRLAECLAAASLYIGNDSGVTHLAAAVGCPTIAIFGPASNLPVWAPQGDHVRIVTGDPWPAVHAVAKLCTKSDHTRVPRTSESACALDPAPEPAPL